MSNVEKSPGFWRQAAKVTGTLLAVGAMLGIASQTAALVYDYLEDKVLRQRRWRKLIKEYPEFKNNPIAHRSFDVLHSFAPKLTKSPHITAAWIKRTIEYPEAGFLPSSIKELAETQQSLSRGRRTAIEKIVENIPYPGAHFSFPAP